MGIRWDRESGHVKFTKRSLSQDDRLRMRIAIPSMGRPDAVKTLRIWPKEWTQQTYLVVTESEAAAYKRSYPGIKQIVVEQSMAQGIAATRQYIWGQAQDVEYVCQVSDDLRFAWRDPYLKLHGATELHLCDIFDRIYTLLDEGWMHVGLSARGGNNHVDVPVKVIGRMCDVYAHRHHDCKRLKVRFDRVPVMEDFDVTLQLLELGHPNAIIYDYCWDQNSSNSDGGCSLYRTPELQAEGAQGLTRLHPSFVSTVERSSNNWKGFPGTRLDVRVQWQRAYDAWGKRPGAKPGQVLTGMGSGLRRSVMGRKPKLVKKSLPGDSGNYTATPDIMTAPKKVIVRKKKKILRKKPRDPDQGDMF